MQTTPIRFALAALLLIAPSGFALADSYSGSFSFTRDGVTITGTITEDGDVIVESEGDLTDEELELLADLEEAAEEGRVVREDARAEFEAETGVTSTDYETRQAERDAFVADAESSYGDTRDDVQESVEQARDDAGDSFDDARDAVETAVNDARDAVSDRFN